VGLQQSKLGGEVSTMKADLEDKRKELETEYHEIDKKYKDELIKVKVRPPGRPRPSVAPRLTPCAQTAEVANLDLEKYGKALDA
jgi:DNA repair protein RAD50